MTEGWDVVIVGAGSAGCVLAAELSRDESRRVLVLEAGAGHPPDALPADIASIAVPYEDHHQWGDAAESAAGVMLPYARGRVVGGSSAINSTMAFRPPPTDVDGWGLPGWGWADLLPHFVAIEHDRDLAAPWHGADGPLPVVRHRDDELSEPQRWFVERALALGFPAVTDHNDPTTTGGIGAIPMNRQGTRRVSAADAWLHPALDRPNLELRADSPVERIVVQHGRATGVVVAGETIPAGEVVVCAGAIATPLLLRRSGLDDPAIGENLSDHPSVPVRIAPPPEPVTGVSPLQVMLRAHDLDTMVFPINSGVVFASPQTVATRGRVASHPDGSPRIVWPFLDDPECRRALRRALRLAWELAGDRRRDDLTVADDAALDAYVTRFHRAFLHACGTCAMGTVVDAELRVAGVDGLRVCDASVLPVVPRVNPHLTVLAVAHRAAALITGS